MHHSLIPAGKADLILNLSITTVDMLTVCGILYMYVRTHFVHTLSTKNLTLSWFFLGTSTGATFEC